MLSSSALPSQCGASRPTPRAIRVLIVDDLAVVRSGLRLCIKAFDDLELVGEAANSNEAIQLCDQINPDIVLMDLDMPGLCSVAAMRLIRYHHPHVQVVAMSSFQGESMLQNMLDNGAIGSLLKNISSDELASTIRAAYQHPRPARETLEPTFRPRPNVPCKGSICPWGWNCQPASRSQSVFD